MRRWTVHSQAAKMICPSLVESLKTLLFESFKNEEKGEEATDPPVLEGIVWWVAVNGHPVALLTVHEHTSPAQRAHRICPRLCSASFPAQPIVETWIWNVCVDPEWRGRKLSLVLLRAVQQGRTAALHLAVRRGNWAARSIYERAHFNYLHETHRPVLWMKWRRS